MNLTEAKEALDKIIRKSRVHLYKPTQVAEILFRDRTISDIDLSKLESYRTASRKWRNKVSLKFVGRTSTSSARYQDDVFNNNATPPEALVVLGKENKDKNGIVEAYIYRHFSERQSQMAAGLEYCLSSTSDAFQLIEFFKLFRDDPGLKRSVDKIYEIVTYALFSLIVEELDAKVSLTINQDKIELLDEFKEFSKIVLGIDAVSPVCELPARLFRVGVTNAADRGLDIWANFGPAIQVKHLSLNEELAESIVDSVTADRIVIVCKSDEKKILISVVTQLGWKSRIQGIITEDDLIDWYEKALRGKYASQLGEGLLKIMAKEIENEFPASDPSDLKSFFAERGYDLLSDSYW